MLARRLFLLAALLAWAGGLTTEAAAQGPKVRLTTNVGVIELELDDKRAPVTVRNFLGYVKSGHYAGTVFHRVMRGFMIQGGGFTRRLERKPPNAPIRNEADNGLKNVNGAIAMARGDEPHSATAQFFINTVDNPKLDHTSKDEEGWGYTVFGRVVKGMDVVRRIEDTPTTTVGLMEDVPRQIFLIEKAEILR